MKTKNSILGAVIVVALAACATAPTTRHEERALQTEAESTLQAMVSRDPSMHAVLENAAGYVVYPEVAEGGFIAGAEAGVGVVYRNDRQIGYSELRGGSIGLQVGGQSYAQVVVFQTEEALRAFQSGNFAMSADVTATAVQSGAARNASFERGVAVFIDDEEGLMAGATITGQNMSFTTNRPRHDHH